MIRYAQYLSFYSKQKNKDHVDTAHNTIEQSLYISDYDQVQTTLNHINNVSINTLSIIILTFKFR